METAYGIGVQNRYALFLADEDDTSDPYALLTNASEPELKPKTAPTKTPSAKPITNVAKVAPTDAKPNQQNQKDSGRPNRARVANSNQHPRTFNRENQENRTNRSPRTYNNFEHKEEDLNDGKADFRSDPKDRKVPRGGGGGGGRRNGGAPLRFRNSNRHSGSDKSSVKPTDKRDGGGAHNWGKPVDDFNTTADDEEVVNGEKATEESEKATTEQEGGDVGQENVEPKNDEPQFKTLDEYKREMEEKRMHTQFNIRKANEGEDKSKWKKTYVLKKKPEFEEEEVEYEEIEVEEDSSKRRNRQVLDIEVNFRPSEDGREFVRRGGRGGRGGPGGQRRANDTERRPRTGGNFGDANERPSGGGRGGRGRDRERGGRFQPAPKFDDLNDFPSLSS